MHIILTYGNIARQIDPYWTQDMPAVGYQMSKRANHTVLSDSHILPY